METKAKRDFNGTIKILDKRLGPFIFGNTYRMEFWIAKIFIKNDILELADDNKWDVQKIQKIAFTEGRSQEIKKTEDYLFTGIREYLEIMKYKKDMGLIPERIFKTLVSNMQDLITVRLRKIILLIQTKNNIALRENLSEEEKILIDDLSNNFGQWKEFFMNF
ncbi:MAG: hypothetical protein ACTSVC_16380 [Promethearchaeota archaeon]